jgi:two-component system chemotaxis sensor kinase CheA
MASVQLRKVFVMESEDRLQQMEESLLHLEENPQDSEAINVIFRAAHTIKGSAGVVGLEAISSFMHVMENRLDKVRSGSIMVTSELVHLLLDCHDFIVEWLNQASESEELSDDLAQTRERLLNQLEHWQDASAQTKAVATPKQQAAPPSEPPPKGATPEVDSQQKSQAFEEFNAILQSIKQAVQALKQNMADEAVLDNIMRFAMNLKNTASMIKLNAMQQLGQALEKFLARRSADDRNVDQAFLEHLDIFCDTSQHMLDYIDTNPDNAYANELPDKLAEALAHIVTAMKQYASEPNLPRQSGQPSEQAVIAHATLVDTMDYTVGAGNWHISLRFKPDAMRNGIEPMHTLHYLSEYGQITHMKTLFDAMPEAEEMEPDACYVGVELGFQSDLDKRGIEDLFELVRDDCDIRILPPHSELSRYIKMIRELPEETTKLGEILIHVGTLTQRELEAGLSLQSDAGQETVFKQPRLGEILVDQGLVPQDVVNAAIDKQNKNKQLRTPVTNRNLHVDATKLDQLIDLVGELVITNASMKLLAQDMNDERLKKVGTAMARLVEEIRNRTLGMRMIPIGDTFSRYRRLVHDLSASLDKKVELSINGAETELDKSMVEKISDPLMHLVRNAIDHGLESTEERRAAGKPEVGIVELNAYHDSGSIVIEVSDDGRGMDVEKILDAAIQNGLANEEQEYTEQEIYNFIFEPGLSTAREVTQVSGRGVGLDVVKRNLSALNGIVNIETEVGKGSTIQIYLPLTLAIIDGFLLNVADSSFVVPLDRVIRCVKFTPEHQQEAQHGYINLRGKVLSIMDLREVFGLPPHDDGNSRNIVVVRYGNREAGLIVDGLQGEFQAVIKPLGKIFERMAGISGATILGNGEVALILDVPALVTRYVNHTSAKGKSTHEVLDKQLVAETVS